MRNSSGETACNNTPCEYCSLVTDKGYSRLVVKFCIFDDVFYLYDVYMLNNKRIYEK